VSRGRALWIGMFITTTVSNNIADCLDSADISTALRQG
jgi:hypothetical protein